MKRVKHGKKIRKFITEIISLTLTKDVSTYLEEINDFHQLARKIPEEEHEAFEQYFDKHMTHQVNLVQIHLRKIDMKYKDTVHRTSKQSVKFNSLLADPKLKQGMRAFYQKEYLKILNPMYFLEQLKDNFSRYIEVLEITQDEFSEWFFLGRFEYLKQLLQPYIVENDSKSKETEIWIYKKYAQELTVERKKKMYKQAGLDYK